MPKNWALQPPHKPNLKKHQLLVSSMNVRSARANDLEIIQYIHETEPHCLCLQETWGYNTITQGYSFISNHRPTKGGGVSIVFKNSLKLKLGAKIMSKDLEAILCTNNSLIILNLYRPPKGSVPSMCDMIKEILRPFDSDKRKKLVIGDFM